MQKRQVIQLDPLLEQVQAKQKQFFDLKQKFKDVGGKTVAEGLKVEGTIVDKAKSGLFQSGERYFKADLLTKKLICKADLMTKDSDSKNTIIDLNKIVQVENPKSLMSGEGLIFVAIDKNEKRCVRTQFDLKCSNQ